jgi:hypothetical protein
MKKSAVVLLLSASVAFATETTTPLKKGFWRVLVKPNAKWVLPYRWAKENKEVSPVVVETYDVRKVGSADVARLRFNEGSEKLDSVPYTQFAVTDAGLYIFSAAEDDAAIAQALKGKPSRSDPPKAYMGTKKNHGRYLRIDDSPSGPIACLGEGPEPGAPDCEDVCYGEVCVSPDGGVVRIEGTWAPNSELYENPKYSNKK